MSADPLQDLLREADRKAKTQNAACIIDGHVAIPRGLWNEIMGRIGREDDGKPDHGHDLLVFPRELRTTRHEGRLPTGDGVSVSAVQEATAAEGREEHDLPVGYTSKNPAKAKGNAEGAPTLVVNAATGRYHAYGLHEGATISIEYTVAKSAPQEDLP